MFGDPSGQNVATNGRKMLVAWIGNVTFASQSLPRDISLAPKDGTLRQAWVPELQSMRVARSHSVGEATRCRAQGEETPAGSGGEGGVADSKEGQGMDAGMVAVAGRRKTNAGGPSEAVVNGGGCVVTGGGLQAAVGGGLQLEVLARFAFRNNGTEERPSAGSDRSNTGARRFGIQVLQTADGAEGTQIGVDLDAQIVFIDGRRSKSCEAMPWLCPSYQPAVSPPSLPPPPPTAPALPPPPPRAPLRSSVPDPPSPRRNGLYLAGPLLGGDEHSAVTSLTVHCYLDGVYVSCIFNNQTAITAMVTPSADAVADVTTFGEGAGGDAGSSAGWMQVQVESWQLVLPPA